MKKSSIISCFLCCILLACGFTACDNQYNKEKPKFSHLEEVNNPAFRLGLPLGAKAMHVGERQMPDARPCYFNSHYSAYIALLEEKIDAYMFDSHSLDYVAANSRDFAILPGSAGLVDIAVGISPRKPELQHEVNAFIDAYKTDGTYQNMYDRWVKLTEAERSAFSRPQLPDMPAINAPKAPTRTLVVGTCSQLEPLCFRKPGGNATDLIGFDMELLQRLALHLNAEIRLLDLDYTTLMNKLANGELDMVVAGLNKTKERQKRGIIFSKNYIDSHIVVMVRSNRVEERKK